MRFNTSIPSLLEVTYILLCMFEILFMLGLAYFSISWFVAVNSSILELFFTTYSFLSICKKEE